MGFLDEKRCALCGKSEEYSILHKHHVIKRSTGGTNTDTVYLCPQCHYFIENNPAKAKELGLHSGEYKIIKKYTTGH
jgi:hypothetical protein